MAEGGEDYEMDDLIDEEEEEETSETSFTDGDQRRSLVGHHTFGIGDITRVTEGETNHRFDDGFGAHESAVTERRKKLLKDVLKITVNKTDGKESKYLLENIGSVYGKKSGLIGLEFKGERVIVRKKGEFVYSEAEKNAKAVERSKERVRKVGEEHSRKVTGAVEKANNDPTTSSEVVHDVISHVIPESEILANEIEENLRELAEKVLLDKQVVREFIGMLDPHGTSVEKIEALRKEADHYRQKAAEEEYPLKKELYESFIRVAEMKADTIRIRIGDTPQHIDVISILNNEVENNDLN